MTDARKKLVERILLLLAGFISAVLGQLAHQAASSAPVAAPIEVAAPAPEAAAPVVAPAPVAAPVVAAPGKEAGQGR